MPISEDELLQALIDAKLAGKKLTMEPFFDGRSTYVFRSNEQAAALALDVIKDSGLASLISG